MGSKSNMHVIEEGRGEVVAGTYCLRVDRVYYKGCHFLLLEESSMRCWLTAVYTSTQMTYNSLVTGLGCVVKSNPIWLAGRRGF